MVVWRFMDYCSEAGNNLIEEWYASQTEVVQAEFDATLKTLSITPDWRGMKEFKMLSGKYAGLGEIRFKSRGVQFRPAGKFGPGQKVFTILVGCSKKQKIFKPPNAFDLAIERDRNLKRGKGGLRERIV